MPTVDHKISVNPEQLAKLEVAKQWAKKNWKPFVTGAAVAGITVFVLRGRSAPTIINNNVTPLIAPIFNNTINNGGYMRKIVRCVETDEMWPSVGKAAEVAGVPISLMSQHLNGHKEVLNGMHFVIEGLAAG